MSSQEHEELTTLLIQKDATLKETMKLASEQGDLDNTMKQLQDEVQKQDNDIKQLQKQLKEAETVLVPIKILTKNYTPPFFLINFNSFFYISVNCHLSSSAEIRFHSKG